VLPTKSMLKMEGLCSSEMLVPTYQAKKYHKIKATISMRNTDKRL
jgi:hypothetical protein